MKVHRYETLRRKHFTAEQLKKQDEAIEAEILEMNLQEIRAMLGKTQVEVAQQAKMSQGELSLAERRQDHLISTLRRLVKALGGELEVRANFDNKSIRLVGV
jgi:hypothetical protein